MDLTFYQYKSPFKKPLKTGKMTFHHREGFLVILEINDQKYVGEASPLPGFSAVSLSEVKRFLIHHRRDLENIFDGDDPIAELQSFYEKKRAAPCLQFAFDSAAKQLMADKQRQNMQDYLFDNYLNKISLNDLISIDNGNYLNRIKDTVDEGFKTIKLKIGRNFERELDAIKAIRKQFPAIHIRLDANQSWSLNEAISHCKKLDELDIQYCEEPLKNGLQKHFGKLSKMSSIPLAIDESIYQIENWTDLLNSTSFCIIKPMMLGSFQNIFKAVERAQSRNNQIILTSSLESGVGRIMTAILASGLETEHLAHGLYTGPLLENDILSDAGYISDGFYHVPDAVPTNMIKFNDLERI